MSVTCVIERLV